MTIPADKPLSALLETTMYEMGIDAAHLTLENRPQKSALLLGGLRKWFTAALNEAQRKLDIDLSTRLFERVFAWDGRTPNVGGITLRPPDSFYFRKDQPWSDVPEGIQGGEFHICAELEGARKSSLPDYYYPAVVRLRLQIGYRACKPLGWLISNWRRPLDRMLLPLKADLVLNGSEGLAVKAFRGKDTVRKAELYLAEPDKDPVMTWQLALSAETTEVVAVRSIAIFLSIYDAIYSLQVQRCDPDRLLRHFVKLESELERVPFRGGFYDPGVTKLEMIEDWNRRHPNEPIPLDGIS